MQTQPQSRTLWDDPKPTALLVLADGTVLEAHAGEGVAMPKGWKGHWSTKGYKKYYVTYTGGAKPK